MELKGVSFSILLHIISWHVIQFLSGKTSGGHLVLPWYLCRVDHPITYNCIKDCHYLTSKLGTNHPICPCFLGWLWWFSLLPAKIRWCWLKLNQQEPPPGQRCAGIGCHWCSRVTSAAKGTTEVAGADPKWVVIVTVSIAMECWIYYNWNFI